MPADQSRLIGRLTAHEISSAMSPGSVLCLPVGSYEQHGPHLSLCTDTVIAEQFTRRLVHRYGHTHDLWALPAIPYGLSPEHAWAPGTITLSSAQFTGLIDAICAEYLQSARRRSPGRQRRRHRRCGGAAATPVDEAERVASAARAAAWLATSGCGKLR